ncbi:MAG: hypothetical protein JO211_09740 [Acidobacteriaceae bacterium]|nr:hypothetical protein [Acidobacteriaceae bacterium]
MVRTFLQPGRNIETGSFTVSHFNTSPYGDEYRSAGSPRDGKDLPAYGSPRYAARPYDVDDPDSDEPEDEDEDENDGGYKAEASRHVSRAMDALAGHDDEETGARRVARLRQAHECIRKALECELGSAHSNSLIKFV